MILRGVIRFGALFALLTATFGESPRVDVRGREDYNPLLLKVLGAMPAGGG